MTLETSQPGQQIVVEVPRPDPTPAPDLHLLTVEQVAGQEEASDIYPCVGMIALLSSTM